MAGAAVAWQLSAEVWMDEEGGSNRGPLIALLVVVLLVVGGIWLQQRLRADNQIQDCVMSGRTNCAPIAPPAK